MVKDCPKAVLLSAIYLFCLIITGTSQSHLRPNANQSAIRGYEKLKSSVLHSVKKQIMNFHHIRNQRQIEAGKLYKDESDVWILQGFQNRRGCPKAAHQFKVFQSIVGEWYAVIATNAVENNTEIYQFSAELGCGKLLRTLPTNTTFDFEIVRDSNVILIVVLEKSPVAYPYKQTGSSVFALTFETNLNVTANLRVVLGSEQPSCLTSWEQFGVPYIAICNSKTREFGGVQSYRTWSYIYCAKGGYFDQCDQIKTHFPQTIKHFRIFSKHYLVVANYPNVTASEHVHTEILRYDVGTDRYKHHQLLPTKGAKDVCFLKIGSGLNADHFLFIVNQLSSDSTGVASFDSKSHIYKFVGEKWEPFQVITLSSEKEAACVAFESEGNRSAIIFGLSGGAEVYQYNGWNFVSTVKYSQFALGSGIKHLGSVRINRETYLTVANSNPQHTDNDNLFSPIFSVWNGTLSGVYGKGMSSCQQMKSELKSDPIRYVVDLYPKAVKKNDTVINMGKVDFKLLSTKRVWTSEVHLKSNKSRLGLTQFSQLQNISSKVDGLLNRFRALTKRKDFAMRKDGNYTINGRVRVKSLISTCRDNGCLIENVTVQNINSVDVVETYRQAIMVNDTFFPSLNVRRLIVKNSINTTTLSNRSITDYVQINENNSFKGKFRINGSLFINGQLSVRGSVNNVKIDPDNLLLRKGNQHLNWTLKSRNILVKNIKTSFLNDKDIGHFYQHAISNSSNFTLLQPKFFSSLTVSKLLIGGRVNKINLTDLVKNSMKIAGDQIVTGTHVYKAAHLGRVNLSGLLNGVQFPNDFISVRENDHLNLNKLQLIQDSVFAHLSVKEKVAGMNVTDGRWGTNLLNKSSNQLQVIVGKKKFETIKSTRDVSSKSLNKHPMDVFQTDDRLYGHPDELLVYDFVAVHGDVTFKKPLSVEKENVGLQLLEEKGVPISTEVFPPIRSLTFTRNMKIVGDLSTNALDGVSSSAFFTRDKKSPLVFSGRKTFNKTVSMNHTFTLFYTLNGYNLRDLWNKALKIEGNQTLPGTLLIQNNVDVVKLKAKTSQLVPLARPGLLTGKKHFKGLSIKGNWFVDELNVAGLINDVNVSSWPSDTILKNRNDQLITSQKSILSLTVKNATAVSTDDVDINHLLDVVLNNQPVTTINSDLMIKGMFFGNRIVVNGSIDGVHSDAPLTWLRTDVNQNLNGSIEVRGLLNIENFQQDSWLINKVNIKDMFNRVVGLNESRQLSSLDFQHIVVDVLELGGLIQGHNVTKDLVLKQSKQSNRTITGIKSFSGPLTSESLHVANRLNGLSPGKVCEVSVPEQTSKWIVYGNVLVKRNAKFNATTVNNQRLNETAHNLWLKDGNANILPKQNFKSVIINGNFSKDEVSNVSLSDLSRRSVKLLPITEQRITASHLFTTIQTNSLSVGLLNSLSINDVGIDHITNSVLLRDIEQNISNHVIFQNLVASSISINGMLNGVNVSTSMMRTDRNQVITGKKSIYNLKVTKAIETCDACLVGTFDLSSWASRSVLRKGNFTLSRAQFESASFQPLNLNGYLNNVTVSRDNLLTLSDQQEINGRLFLSSLLPANILYSSEKGPVYQRTTEEFNLAARFENLRVKGSYDGIDLQRFYNQTVRRDMRMVFSEPVALSSLIAESLDDLSVNSTIRDIIELPVDEPHHVAESGFFVPLVSTEIDHLSNMVTEIGRVISHQSVELKFFEEMTVTQQLPRVVDALFAWESRSGEVELCSFVNEHGELFYDSPLSPLLKEVEVTGVSSLKVSNDFAVATLDRSKNNKHHSFIFSQKLSSKIENQTIPTTYPIDTAAFVLSNKSCYLFLEMSTNSPIYCRPLGSSRPYSLVQNISTIDARMVTVAQRHDTGLPMLIIASVGQRGYGHLTVWAFNTAKSRFVPWKSIDTLQIISMDCICNDGGCLLATVAPSKPAAIPGQVIIWSLPKDGPPTRLQRIAFTEPADVKLAQDPNGRVTLIVLQRSGVDNVFVYVWRGLQQFKHETTVRVPGAQDLQLIANEANLLLALTVALPVTEVPYGPVRMFRANFFGRLN